MLSVVVQSFRDHEGKSASQPQQLIGKLKAIPVPMEIVVNDDAHGEGSAAWQAVLTGPNDYYISSPNLHEVRVYNRLSRMLRGEYLVLVQGDACLPATPRWMMHALRILGALPSLAMLSGRVGFDVVLTRELNASYRTAHTWGQAPNQPIEYSLPAGPTEVERAHPTAAAAPDAAASATSLPFMFAPGVDNGPLIFRRQALLDVGGFDEGYSCAGEVAMHYDFEVAFRFWLRGYQVGAFYGGGTNGVGGRKTLRAEVRKVRHRSEQ